MSLSELWELVTDREAWRAVIRVVAKSWKRLRNWTELNWGVLPWIYPVWDSLGFLDFCGYFLPHIREVFNYYLLRYFLKSFLFVFFFWDTYDSNDGVFNIVPDVSDVVLISFNSFFSLFLSASFIYTSLSSTSLILSLLPQLFYCWFLQECFWSQLLHYSLFLDSS